MPAGRVLPVTESQLEAVPPAFPTLPVGGPGVAGTLDGSCCIYAIDLFVSDDTGSLNTALPWVEANGRWRFVVRDSGVYEVAVQTDGTVFSRPFNIVLEGSLKPPKRDGPGDQYEYDLPFPSAGLPGLGKRR
jgi:hypothetical protein